MPPPPRIDIDISGLHVKIPTSRQASGTGFLTHPKPFRLNSTQLRCQCNLMSILDLPPRIVTAEPLSPAGLSLRTGKIPQWLRGGNSPEPIHR